MTQVGMSGESGESLLNIFPNPCVGDTYLYTDDLEAAWLFIYDQTGSIKEKWAINPGITLHVKISLSPGTYQLILKDGYQNILGLAKPLFVSEHH